MSDDLNRQEVCREQKGASEYDEAQAYYDEMGISFPPDEQSKGAEDREAEAVRGLEMVRRMALYGPGEGTTAEQTLQTIAVFCEKRLARLGDSHV